MASQNSTTMLFTSEDIKRENLKQLLKEVSQAYLFEAWIDSPDQ